MKRLQFTPFTLDIVNVDDDALLRIYTPFKTQLGFHLLIGIGKRNVCLNLYFHLLPYASKRGVR